MASPPRILVRHGLYHVYTCGTGPSVIFRDAGDHEHFDGTLGKTVEMYGWQVLMVVHMSTHVHLLVVTPHANLDFGMLRTKSCYARYFNDKYRRRGALFDERYGYRYITSERQFLRTVRYIARNPVEAGICERARDYTWSSVSATVRGASAWPANGASEVVVRCGGLVAFEELIDNRVDLDDVDYLDELDGRFALRAA